MAEKGYIYPIKKKIPLILLLNLFGMAIISQFLRFVNIVFEIYKITFREGFYNKHCICGRKHKNTAYLFRDMPWLFVLE